MVRASNLNEALKGTARVVSPRSYTRAWQWTRALWWTLSTCAWHGSLEAPPTCTWEGAEKCPSAGPIVFKFMGCPWAGPIRDQVVKCPWAGPVKDVALVILFQVPMVNVEGVIMDIKTYTINIKVESAVIMKMKKEKTTGRQKEPWKRKSNSWSLSCNLKALTWREHQGDREKNINTLEQHSRIRMMGRWTQQENFQSLRERWRRSRWEIGWSPLVRWWRTSHRCPQSGGKWLDAKQRRPTWFGGKQP